MWFSGLAVPALRDSDNSPCQNKKRQDEIGDQIKDRVGSSCVNMLMRLCDHLENKYRACGTLLGTPSDKNDDKIKKKINATSWKKK